MKRLKAAPFFIAVAAEVCLCASLNLFDDWTLEQMPVRFVFAAIAAGIAYLVAVGRFPLALKPKTTALVFWGVAIMLRLVVLPLQSGDDVYRYQWEGEVQRAGFNPYQHPPDDPALDTVRQHFPGWYKINRRDYRVTYPPGAELLFAAASHISGSPLFYKLLFATADLGVIFVLLRLFADGQRYASAAWYAWNPLVVYSFAGSGHYDSMMVLPLLAAIFSLIRFELGTQSQSLLSLSVGVSMGFAISIGSLPLLLLPLCAIALGYRAISLILSLVIPASLSLVYGFPSVPVLNSWRQFTQAARLNDLLWWLTEETIWPNPRQVHYQYDVVIAIAAVILSILFYKNWKRGMLWIVGASLVLAPVLHPWYCTRILPLAAWCRADPWQVLSVTLFAYYLFWNERLFFLPWHSELWLRAIILIPPLVATLFYSSRERQTTKPVSAVP